MLFIRTTLFTTLFTMIIFVEMHLYTRFHLDWLLLHAIYVPIIMYCLRLSIVVLQELQCLQCCLHVDIIRVIYICRRKKLSEVIYILYICRRKKLGEVIRYRKKEMQQLKWSPQRPLYSTVELHNILPNALVLHSGNSTAQHSSSSRGAEPRRPWSSTANVELRSTLIGLLLAYSMFIRTLYLSGSTYIHAGRDARVKFDGSPPATVNVCKRTHSTAHA